jgi:hypothetical protein
LTMLTFKGTLLGLSALEQVDDFPSLFHRL